MSSLQLKLYKQMKDTGMLITNDGKGSKAGMRGLQNTIMQLRKICNHPFVFDEVENLINPSSTSNPLLYRVAGKFELLDRILPKLFQSGHRVLMFFQMTEVMSVYTLISSE
jgi:ATP-dependent helicase STH1/SNF2